MLSCVCLRCLFRKRGYNQVHNKSLANNNESPSAEIPQVIRETPKKQHSEAQISADSVTPTVQRGEKRKETSGIYVFNKDKVQLVQSLNNVGKSHEAPVLVSEDKIAMVRKRLASM